MAKNATILLVEDESSDVFLMRRALLKAGVSNSMHVVRDGEEALLYIRGSEKFADRNSYPMPTVMLLDLNMPKKSGFEVLEWIRSQDDLRHLPVVILSTSSQEQDIRKAYALGANSYLTKPPDFDKLVDIVKVVELNWLKTNLYPST